MEILKNIEETSEETKISLSFEETLSNFKWISSESFQNAIFFQDIAKTGT